MNKVAVVTGSRAEYGLLYWVMKHIQESADMELQVIATGSHLSAEHGYTIQSILDDGFPVTAKVDMLLASDSPVGTAKSMGLGVIGFADAYERLQPDLVVMLGDRFEILAAAQAAMPARIPIAHIHGGERTEGAFDEGIRHAVTKLSHLHFTSAEPYRQRVIQLGEQPDRVFTVGAVGLDNILRLPLLDKESLELSLDFQLGERNFLVTYHPVTLSSDDSAHDFAALLEALDRFPEARVLITKPNADTHHRSISQMIDEYAASHPDRVYASPSLGQLRYLSAIQHVDVVIGNSSSGLIEVPFFHKPTVNVGNRQKGRLAGESVIHCGCSPDELEQAIRQACSSEHLDRTRQAVSPYGEGGASERIVDIIRQTKLDSLVQKSFYDISF